MVVDVPGEGQTDLKETAEDGVFSYIDEQGSLHIVRSKDAVPTNAQSADSSAAVDAKLPGQSLASVHVPSVTLGFALALTLGLGAQVFRGMTRFLLNLLSAGLLFLMLVGSYVVWVRSHEGVEPAATTQRTRIDREGTKEMQGAEAKPARSPSTARRKTKKQEEPAKTGKELLIIDGDDL